jgi:CubicO group peptidase (beta-lactamase class C family)
VTASLGYDLASLTKVLATTFLVAGEVSRGRLDLAATLGDLGWSGPVQRLTLRDLLAHRSGLPPWRPFYLLKSAESPRDRYRRALAQEPLISRPGQETIYSDLNFLILGLVLEDLNGQSLASLFATRVAQPLGLTRLGYTPEWGPLAPTEDGFRVGGPLTYPGLPYLGPVPLGRAHDDNAAGLGGVAGQAGLFGSVGAVWAVLRSWAGILAGQVNLVEKKVLTAFLEPQSVETGPPRALGFALGEGPWAGLVGHWGYTGGGLWWDPVQDWALAFLTNRVHPTAREGGVVAFRQELGLLLGPRGALS